MHSLTIEANPQGTINEGSKITVTADLGPALKSTLKPASSLLKPASSLLKPASNSKSGERAEAKTNETKKKKSSKDYTDEEKDKKKELKKELKKEKKKEKQTLQASSKATPAVLTSTSPVNAQY